MSPRQTMSIGDTLLQLLFRFIVNTLYGAYLPRSYVGSDGLLRQHFPENVCAVPNMTVFCSSRTSWLPGTLPTYFLNDFEMVPVAPVITGITVVFTFHIRWISIVRSLYLKKFSASFSITLLSLVKSRTETTLSYCYNYDVTSACIAQSSVRLFHLHPANKLWCHFSYILACQTLAYGLVTCLKLRPLWQLPETFKFDGSQWLASPSNAQCRISAPGQQLNSCLFWQSPRTRQHDPQPRDSSHFLAKYVFVLTH